MFIKQKGLSLGAAPVVIITIIMIGIITVTGIKVNDAMSESEYDSSTTTNETISITNNTAFTFNYEWVTSITEIENRTLNIVPGFGNVTLTTDTLDSSAVLTCCGAAGNLKTGNYNVTYVKNVKNNIFLMGDNATTGLNTITDNSTLLGLIAIMAVVVTLLFAAFGGTGMGSASI